MSLYFGNKFTIIGDVDDLNAFVSKHFVCDNGQPYFDFVTVVPFPDEETLKAKYPAKEGGFDSETIFVLSEWGCSRPTETSAPLIEGNILTFNFGTRRFDPNNIIVNLAEQYPNLEITWECWCDAEPERLEFCRALNGQFKQWTEFLEIGYPEQTNEEVVKTSQETDFTLDDLNWND